MITLSTEDQSLFENWYMDRVNLYIPETAGPDSWVSDAQMADVLAKYGLDRLFALAAIRYATWRLAKLPALAGMMGDFDIAETMTVGVDEETKTPIFTLKLSMWENDAVDGGEPCLDIEVVCKFAVNEPESLDDGRDIQMTSTFVDWPYTANQVLKLIELAVGTDIQQLIATAPNSFVAKNVEFTYPNAELGTPGIGVLLTATFAFPEGAWVIEAVQQ
jgi:hypothetical protein